MLFISILKHPHFPCPFEQYLSILRCRMYIYFVISENEPYHFVIHSEFCVFTEVYNNFPEMALKFNHLGEMAENEKPTPFISASSCSIPSMCSRTLYYVRIIARVEWILVLKITNYCCKFVIKISTFENCVKWICLFCKDSSGFLNVFLIFAA